VSPTSSSGTERTYKVTPEPRGVDEARRFAELAVSYCDAECREATAMVATELAENMVKYGVKGASPFVGTISISADADVIRVTARNEVASAREAQNAKQAIGQIAATSDVKAMYRSRLAELFATPSLVRAQLGLLRAAFEGGFRLSCSYDPPTLSIVAERRCKAR
jgi:hypothetical protein